MKIGMEPDNAAQDDPLDFREAAPTAGAVGGMLGTKNLLIIIITMPFVFLVVVMAIIGLVGKPDRSSKADTPSVVRSVEATSIDDLAGLATQQPVETQVAGQRVVLPVPASIRDLSSAIALPKGAVPGAISLDGDRMALRVDSADGAMIVIYDLTADRVVKTIPLVEVSGSAMSVRPMPDAPETNMDGSLVPTGVLEKDARDGGIPTPRLADRRRGGN